MSDPHLPGCDRPGPIDVLCEVCLLRLIWLICHRLYGDGNAGQN